MKYLIDHPTSTMSSSSDSFSSQAHDPFDPIYIKLAFTKKTLNLGPLIFGKSKWTQLGGSELASSPSNPLENMFKRRGKWILRQ